jgi:hypothetical protein
MANILLLAGKPRKIPYAKTILNRLGRVIVGNFLGFSNSSEMKV